MARKAMFPDVCARCPDPINKGDMVVPSNGHYIHESCHSGYSDEGQVTPPAPKRAAKKATKKAAPKTWKSGHCNDGNPAESHERCARNPRADGVPCTCFCHMAPDAPAEIASVTPVTNPTPEERGGQDELGSQVLASRPVIEVGLLEGLSNDDYHAQTEWLSSSQLKAALPEHFKTTNSPTRAMDGGTLFHTAVLEPELMGVYVALNPFKVGLKADGTVASSPTSTKAWKDAVAEVEKDGKFVVEQADLDKAMRMRDAIAAHPTASQLMFDTEGRNELSAFAVDENGLKHKARFDKLIPGAGIDLKSTASKPGEDSLTRTVIDYGYDVSALHYLIVAELLNLDVQAFAFVFCSSEPNSRTGKHLVTVAELDAKFLDRGRRLRDQAIARLTDPNEPAYPGASGFLTLSAPEWALRKVS